MIPNGYKETEIGVIPLDWEVVKLGDITTKITSGGTPSRSKEEYFQNGTINWLKTGELKDCYIYDAKEKITEEAIKNSSAKLFPIDTLLIAMYGATIGQTAYLKTECATNQACCAIIFDKEIADSFFYWKYFYFIKDSLIGLGRGAGQPNISQGIIKELNIPLPPLTQQKKIAQILSTADKKIEAIALQIEKAEMVKKGLLQKLLSEGIGHSEFKESGLSIVYPMRKIPNSWNLQKLSDITTKITDGAHFTPTYVEEGVPFLRVTDLKSQDLLSSKIKYIPKKEHLELLKRCNPEYGDILYSKNGTIGLTRIVTWNWEFSIFVSLCLIKPNKELIIPEYLKFYLTSSIVHTQIKIRAKQGAVTNLHLEEIRDFFITVPPLKEQTKIANILTTADEKLEVLRAKKAKYEELKVGLMQKLLTGEVRV